MLDDRGTAAPQVVCALHPCAVTFEDIFVLPEQRRGGIGARFMSELRRIARREGCGRMEWMALDWNAPAHRFYRKLGAKTVDDWVLYRVSLANS